MLPMLFRVKVQDEKKPFWLYMPLGLVHLLFVPLLILGSIAIVVPLAIPRTARQARPYLQLVLALPSLLSASIGTEIAIQSNEKDIAIYIL
ncbi:MAG TPA: hypothetical protein DCG32_05605 [Sphaerochaeta sp.]|nr:hypothetical protein [Sphaerochaeta sp.]